MFWLPPWLGLLSVLLLLGALAAWVLQRGLKTQRQAVGTEQQAQTNRRIHQEHLADLDRALADGRLTSLQHQAAGDELLRHLLDDAEQADAIPAAAVPGRWLWMVAVLVVLSGLSYLQLGSPQTWWPLPLSQRVQISATTPAKWAEQTRVWEQATQKRPEDAEAWLTLARLHAAQNAHALAEQALTRVLALAPEPDLWIERAQMKALSAGGVYAGEPWQWIQNVLRDQPLHLNALVLAGSAALSEQRHADAQGYWQRALALVPADSDAAQGLQQALDKAQELQRSPRALAAAQDPVARPGNKPLIEGEVRISSALKSQIPVGATLFVYALAEEGARRPVAIWRGTPEVWPVQFALSDSMGMGAPPVLSELAQVRLVARISKTGSAQKQEGDWQVELPGVKTGMQGVVLNFAGRMP
jgi:cytochrome c-type biogenesis protein CcmH